MYKGMQNRILKNYQVKIGSPLQIHPIFNQVACTSEDLEVPGTDEFMPIEHIDTPEEALEKARQEAELIIKEAMLESQKIIEKATAEAESKREEIEAEAWQKGYEEGLSQGKKEYEDLLKEAELIREHATTEYNEVLASIESDTVEVILDVSRKVIGCELRQEKDCILQIVRQAFEKCENKDGITVRVSAEDFDYLTANREKLSAIIEGFDDFEIKKDCSLKQGSCIIDTAFGSVDSGIQTRLKKIEEAFREAATK